jgi:hypothetical protein
MRSRWLAESAPPVLGGVAEAGWIGVYAAATGALSVGNGAWLSIVALVLAALTGVAAGRWLPFGRWRPVLLLAVAVAVGIAGSLATSAAAAVPPTTTVRFLSVVLLGLAVLRGAAHGDRTAGDRVIDLLMRAAPVLIGAGWILGIGISGPARPAFEAGAFGSTILFIVAGTLGLGSARLLASATSSGHDQEVGRAWFTLVLLVVITVVFVALPIASLLGVPLAGSITAALIGAGLLVAGTILGVAGAVAAILGSLLGALGSAPGPTPAPVGSPPPGVPQPVPLPAPGVGTGTDVVGPILLLVLVIVLVLVAWYLAVRWQGKPGRPAPPPAVTETRSISLAVSLGLPTLSIGSRLRRIRSPRDALEAYLQLLEHWSTTRVLAKRPSETPAAHARRLRSEGHGELSFDLLVADVELSRFGAVHLSAREEGRAIARGRTLRSKER